MNYCQARKQEGSGHLIKVQTLQLLSGTYVELYDVIPQIASSFEGMLAAVPCRESTSRTARMEMAAERLEKAIQDMDAILTEAASEVETEDRRFYELEKAYDKDMHDLFDKDTEDEDSEVRELEEEADLQRSGVHIEMDQIP
jgi:hypothetical protein